MKLNVDHVLALLLRYSQSLGLQLIYNTFVHVNKIIDSQVPQSHKRNIAFVGFTLLYIFSTYLFIVFMWKQCFMKL